MPSYELDKDNPLWVEGWGVYRMSPWHLVGLCLSKAEAEAQRSRAGQEYEVGFGSRQLGTDNFVVASADQWDRS